MKSSVYTATHKLHKHNIKNPNLPKFEGVNRTSGSFYIATQNKLRDAHLRSAAFFERNSLLEVNSIFALFGGSLSGGEEVVEGVRFNARLELSMKPIEHMPMMAALDLTPGLTNGDMALPLPRP